MQQKRHILFFFLFILLGGCSDIDDSDLHRIDLCVAVQDGDTYAFFLDKGLLLVPDNMESLKVSVGERYQLHYCVSSLLMNDESRIHGNVFDIYPIRTVPLLLTEDTDSHAVEYAVRLERIWMGGGFLNLTVGGNLPSGGENVFFQGEGLSDNTLHIRLHLLKPCSQDDVQSTFSCRLSDVRDSFAKEILSVEVLEYNEDNESVEKYTLPLTSL